MSIHALGYSIIGFPLWMIPTMIHIFLTASLLCAALVYIRNGDVLERQPIWRFCMVTTGLLYWLPEGFAINIFITLLVLELGTPEQALAGFLASVLAWIILTGTIIGRVIAEMRAANRSA